MDKIEKNSKRKGNKEKDASSYEQKKHPLARVSSFIFLGNFGATTCI